MQATAILSDEHRAVLTVLDQLERAVSAAEQGAAIPADVFSDIQEFFAVFVDRCHHGKEEAELFPRLIAAGQSELVRRLEAEHVTGRQRAAAYAQAVQAYQPGQRERGARLASAARAYADLLREHIALEDRALLPAIEQALPSADPALVRAFDRIEEERIGPGTHARLHGMIDSLAGRIDPWLRPEA